LIHRLSTIAMPPLMDDIEGDGVNLPGIGYVELGIELYPYVKVDDEDKFFNWLRRHRQRRNREAHHPSQDAASLGRRAD
jgi:hypothetical protein